MHSFEVAIVIPTHSETPTPLEQIGLRRCAEVSTHPIVLVTPKSLSIVTYSKLLPIAKHITVEDRWMSSIVAYNKLMISGRLFVRLQDFSHALIHEPDAILLEDALDYWCSQPIDYVGAPWFITPGQGATPQLYACGNSGLSLLNIAVFRKLLSSRSRWYPAKAAAKDIIKGAFSDVNRLKKGVLALGRNGRLHSAWRIYDGHCDTFWSFILPKTSAKLAIADPVTALSFSWETYPEECSRLACGRLPLGLHAWSKYEPAFTSQLLRDQGIQIPPDSQAC